MQDKPLINILIRTGKRQRLFERCIKTVVNQTYKNIRIIVSCDTNADYVNGYEVIRVNPKRQFKTYWNLYCNELKREVNDGWFFFLDDDDFIVNATAIEDIIPHLINEDIAVICQFNRWKQKKPDDTMISNKLIIRGKVGMPCIFLHNSKKDIAEFDGYEAADFRFIKKVSELMEVKFIHHVVVQTDMKSNGK